MARVTQNPKVIGGGICLALMVAIYLHGPAFWQQITAPPPKPAVPPAPIVDEVKFYQMVPKQLPEKWSQVLQGQAPGLTMFDEVPRDVKIAKQEVLPELPIGWHLSSIYYSKEERVAVVSGNILREGDWLDPFTVKKIEEDKVTFRHPQGERQMEVGQRVGEPGPRTQSNKLREEVQDANPLVPKK